MENLTETDAPKEGETLFTIPCTAEILDPDYRNAGDQVSASTCDLTFDPEWKDPDGDVGPALLLRWRGPNHRGDILALGLKPEHLLGLAALAAEHAKFEAVAEVARRTEFDRLIGLDRERR